MTKTEFEVICDVCGIVKEVKEYPHICEPCPRTKARIIADQHEHHAMVRLVL